MVKKTVKEGEELLAKILVNLCEYAFGIDKGEHSSLEKGQEEFARFFLKQALEFATADAAEPIYAARATRILRAGLLGTAYLKVEAQDQFERWVARSESLLRRPFVTESVIRFYRLAGELAGKSRSDLDAIRTFNNRAIEIIKRLDPMTYSEDIRESDLFVEINNLAGTFKLKAHPKQIASIGEMLDDISFLIRGQYRALNIDAPDSHRINVSARPGAVLELLRLVSKLLARMSVSLSETDVSISLLRSQLRIHVHWEGASLQQSALHKSLDSSTIYQFLKGDLPFREAEISGSDFEFLIFGAETGNQLQNALQLASAFTDGRPQAPELCELLASWLHDIKNDLVAFQAAVHNARKASSNSEKYRHTYMASKHIEATEEYLRSIALVVGAESPAQLATIDLKDFFRDIVSDVLSWAPSSVAVIPPSNTDQATIVSDPRILRTVLLNLCKNAAEAIRDAGRLTLEWVFDPQGNILEIELTDSAGALSKEACAQLNTGFTILSQKPTGSGVGLLTVLLMLKQLGGRAVFSCEPGRQTSVQVELPSVTEELASGPVAEPAIVSVEAVDT